MISHSISLTLILFLPPVAMRQYCCGGHWLAVPKTYLPFLLDTAKLCGHMMIDWPMDINKSSNILLWEPPLFFSCWLHLIHSIMTMARATCWRWRSWASCRLRVSESALLPSHLTFCCLPNFIQQKIKLYYVYPLTFLGFSSADILN